MAIIEMWTGPMFAGKTTNMLGRVYEWQQAGVEVLLLKHAADKRYGDGTSVTTHEGVTLAAELAENVEDLHQAIYYRPTAKVVAVDEVQWFDEGIVPWARIARSKGITVLLAGLDRRSAGDPFDPMPLLLAHADVVHKLSGTCSCGSRAHQTMRRKDAPDGWVGGAERYETVCWPCWHERTKR